MRLRRYRTLVVFTAVRKKIGILGGMGPEATIDLYRRIVQIFQREYDAIDDGDFPEMILYNLPLADVVRGITEEKTILDALITAAKMLEKSGADFIAIPCNTAMFFLPELRKAVSIPIVSIVEETAQELQKRGIRKVGILGTEVTLATGLYSEALGDIAVVLPEYSQRRTLTRIIINILAGVKSDDDRQRLLRIARELELQGAQKIILGCTELSLLVEGKTMVNTTEILARSVVRMARGGT